MIKAELHFKETERLKALKSLNILDTVTEKEFDDLTLMASQICNTPIALISLIDEKRQWFKSKVGLTATETHRDFSFCAHAILQDDVFIVDNVTTDKRFFDNPLVNQSIKIQYYAGAPIYDPKSKLPIGTLCVVDTQPRQLSAPQLQALKALSSQIQKLLELKLKVRELSSVIEATLFQKVAFEKMTEGVVVQDITGNIIDFNPGALNVLEMTADQLLGKSSMDKDWNSINEDGTNLVGSDHPAMKCLASGLAQSNSVMGLNIDYKSTKWINVSSTPIFLNTKVKPSHCVTTFSDITGSRLTQQTLIQSAKMTSLGEMAGEIAHEINSPLAILSLASYQSLKLLQQDTKNVNKVIKKIELIESTVQRISKIVKGLSTFTRSSEKDTAQIVSLNQITLEAIDICSDKFKKTGIKIITNLDKEFKVSGIPTMISQVLVNLLNNSFDAIKDKPKKWVRVELMKKNENVKICIIDCGLGISKDLQSKIMKSFFTTKPAGAGTGLGLSISKEIIESLNGRLYYEKVGKNTCFSIEIPIHK